MPIIVLIILIIILSLPKCYKFALSTFDSFYLTNNADGNLNYLRHILFDVHCVHIIPKILVAFITEHNVNPLNQIVIFLNVITVKICCDFFN